MMKATDLIRLEGFSSQKEYLLFYRYDEEYFKVGELHPREHFDDGFFNKEECEIISEYFKRLICTLQNNKNKDLYTFLNSNSKFRPMSKKVYSVRFPKDLSLNI